MNIFAFHTLAIVYLKKLNILQINLYILYFPHFSEFYNTSCTNANVKSNCQLWRQNNIAYMFPC